MYSRKSVGSRIDPWGTPTLTGYSCEDFPSRTTRSRLLLRKEEIRPNIVLRFFNKVLPKRKGMFAETVSTFMWQYWFAIRTGKVTGFNFFYFSSIFNLNTLLDECISISCRLSWRRLSSNIYLSNVNNRNSSSQ